MIGHALDRVAADKPLPGLIVTTKEQTIGEAISDILIIAELMSEDKIRQHAVLYLPLR